MLKDYEDSLARINKEAVTLSQLHTGLVRKMTDEIKELHKELTENEIIDVLSDKEQEIAELKKRVEEFKEIFSRLNESYFYKKKYDENSWCFKSKEKPIPSIDRKHKYNEWNVCEKCGKGMEEYESLKEATESECKTNKEKLIKGRLSEEDGRRITEAWDEAEKNGELIKWNSEKGRWHSPDKTE